MDKERLEKVLDDYQHATGDESLLKYQGRDLFLPSDVDFSRDKSDQYDFSWQDYIITQENGGILNNLNFDNDDTGLGVSSFRMQAGDLGIPIVTRFQLFGAAVTPPPGFVRLPAKFGGTPAGETFVSQNPTVTQTTLANPIRISGLIYSVVQSSFDPLIQLNEFQLDFQRTNIDGSVLKKGDIQPNFLRRNWWFQNDFVVIRGDLEINALTEQLVTINENTECEYLYLVESIGK